MVAMKLGGNRLPKHNLCYFIVQAWYLLWTSSDEYLSTVASPALRFHVVGIAVVL